MRLEIQFLRAAAVLGVLLFHLWPGRLPGGYAGVDIFFVISGFLITSQLVRAVPTEGFSFGAFYARRARRILPSALLVLVATSIAIVVFVGLENWSNFFKEVLASSLFYENWVLAANSVDYLAQENAASPVQHYWSLSVEEQFYLIWPLLLWVVYKLARRTGRDVRAALMWAMLGVVVASLATSVVLTASDPASAYFSTATRVWEFAAGGLLALALGSRVVERRSVRLVLQIVGWGAVAASFVLLTPSTPFPGYAALLPVLAAVFVIAGGVPEASIRPRLRALARPILIVAEISFALYLWHWPLIIIADSLDVQPLSTARKIGILAASIILAWLTTRYVEGPIRKLSVADVPVRRVLLASGAAIAATALIAASMLVASNRFTTTLASAQEAQSTKLGACVGAGYADPANDCDGVTFSGLTPIPLLAVDDKPAVYSKHCWDGSETVTVCRLGVPDGRVRVALLGDSHAIAMSPALQIVASEFGWSVDTYFKSACPFFSGKAPVGATSEISTCFQWNANVQNALSEAKKYDIAFVTYSDALTIQGTGSDAVNNFRQAWQALIDRGTTIVVVRDFPDVGEGVDCLIKSPESPESCAVPQETAERTDYMVAAAEGMDGVFVVDLTDLLCSEGICQVAVGGVTAYRDSHHLTKTFSESLAPALTARLRQIGVLDEG